MSTMCEWSQHIKRQTGYEYWFTIVYTPVCIVREILPVFATSKVALKYFSDGDDS